VRGATSAGSPLPKIAIWHGDADYTVCPQNASDIASQWVEAHGLSHEAGLGETLPNRTRTVWHAPNSDLAMIELNLVHGLGHGTPLSTSGETGLGSVGPFMLEAGISSSLEIARFWELAERDAAPTAAKPELDAERAAEKPPVLALVAVGDQVVSSISPHVPPSVLQVIEGALKRAGLRR
jgi:hypothetical protein